MPNLHFIRKNGIKPFVARQAERMRLLALLLEGYDDGRSKSFYCRIASLADVTAVREALAQASKEIERERIADEDHRSKARILKSLLEKTISS